MPAIQDDKLCSSECLSDSLKLTALACFPRAMGDIVEEMDSHRRKSFGLLTRKGGDGRAEGDYSEQPPLSRASRSFSRVRAPIHLPHFHEKSTVMTVPVPHVHEALHRLRKDLCLPDARSFQAILALCRVRPNEQPGLMFLSYLQSAYNCISSTGL